GRIDVGEDLELTRTAHVVAVAGRTVRYDLVSFDRAHLSRLEWLDHLVLVRHATDPVVGLDAHRFSLALFDHDLRKYGGTVLRAARQRRRGTARHQEVRRGM